MIRNNFEVLLPISTIKRNNKLLKNHFFRKPCEIEDSTQSILLRDKKN